MKYACVLFTLVDIAPGSADSLQYCPLVIFFNAAGCMNNPEYSVSICSISHYLSTCLHWNKQVQTMRVSSLFFVSLSFTNSRIDILMSNMMRPLGSDWARRMNSSGIELIPL